MGGLMLWYVQVFVWGKLLWCEWSVVSLHDITRVYNTNAQLHGSVTQHISRVLLTNVLHAILKGISVLPMWRPPPDQSPHPTNENRKILYQEAEFWDPERVRLWDRRSSWAGRVRWRKRGRANSGQITFRNEPMLLTHGSFGFLIPCVRCSFPIQFWFACPTSLGLALPAHCRQCSGRSAMGWGMRIPDPQQEIRNMPLVLQTSLLGSQHRSPNVKNPLQLRAKNLARNYHITWCPPSACFLWLQDVMWCDNLLFFFFWACFGQEGSRRVIDASCWSMLTVALPK